MRKNKAILTPKANRGTDRQPLSRVEWLLCSVLHANDYNPNKVFGPEMELLKISIIENGWTQPVVITPDRQIVDGFHRWTLCKTDKEVARLTAGTVPCVTIRADASTLQMATIRHNRARGQHGLLKMSAILQKLKKQGCSPEVIGQRLQMEPEEVARLLDLRSSPDKASKDSFGKGWIPDSSTKKK